MAVLLTPVRRIAVGDITFLVRTPWGVMRQFIQRLAEIEASGMGERSAEAAVEQATRELLEVVVVGWEGPCDETGCPLAWRPERLDELDTAVVAELVRRIAEPPEELGTKKDGSG